MNYDQAFMDHFYRVWKNMRPPIRPSEPILEVYRREMERYPELSVLILGATPELIDLAIDLKAKTLFSIERYAEIMEAMRRLGSRDWANVDLINGDWLEENPDYINRFNMIGCDGGLIFLDYPDSWEELFRLAYSYLEPGGVFVHKGYVMPASDWDYSQLVVDLLDSFNQKQRTLTVEKRKEAYRELVCSLRCITCVDAVLDDCSYDQEILVSGADGMFEQLCERYPDPELVEIAESAMKHLGRSRPGTTDIVAAVSFENAEKLLNEQGFETSTVQMPDPPVHGANYMVVARK